MFAELAKLFFEEKTKAFDIACEIFERLSKEKKLYLSEFKTKFLHQYVVRKLKRIGIVKVGRETKTKRGRVTYRYYIKPNSSYIEKLIGLLRLLGG